MQQPIGEAAGRTTPTFTVRTLDPREIGTLADLLADVFADNPAYRLIFDQKDASAGLRWMFARALWLNLRCGTVKVICLTTAPEEIVGTFSLIPPEAPEPSLVDFIRVGIVGMPFRFGVAALVRMLSLMKENQEKITEATEGERCWYLGMVAVAKPCRNRGIASSALAEAFAELPRPCTIALSTQLESNVRLYARLGFQIRAENYMGYRKKTVRNWVMSRRH